MTRVNTEQLKHTPWFAKAGAACSIVPIARFVGPNIFALKGGGYGCLFALTGIDEEGLTDQELESRMRSIEGSLRGLPEGSCLYQYTRVMSGFDLPRQAKYANPATEVFASDRLTFLENTAGFRRIDLHWCLTLEPSKVKAFERKPQENAADTSRMLADLEKTATILQSHLGSAIGLQLLGKDETFQFFSYLFNLEEWARTGSASQRCRCGPADRENSGCVAQRLSPGRQAPRADVFAKDDAGSVEAVPLLRPVHARLRQRPVLDMEGEVHLPRPAARSTHRRSSSRSSKSVY